jgi:outer membrane immunogenic protein
MRIVALVTFLLAGTGIGLAADIQEPVSPEISAERFGWTGAYIGASAGYGWLKDVDYAPAPPFVAPLHDQGEDWVYGGYAGYLQQFGNFVVGAEAEAMKLDITYDNFNFITIKDSVALKGRAGYAWDRFLLTGHGGAVYARTNFMDLKDWGWTAGGGIDYALTDNLTVGAQYTHFDFSEFDGTKIDATIDLVTARVGIKF